MSSALSRTLAFFLSVALVVAGLWLWQNAMSVASDASRPDVARWALRSAAVACIAAAQVVLSVFVIDAFFRRDLFATVLRFTAALVTGAAIVSAVALGIAGR